MKVTAFLRQKSSAKNNVTDQATVFFRVRDGKTDLKAASELTINPNHWSQEKQGYKSRVALVREEKRRAFDNQVREITNLISERYYRGAGSEWLRNLLESYHHPNIFTTGETAIDTSLAAQARDYAQKHDIVESSAKTYCYIAAIVERFQLYQRKVNHRKNFVLHVDSMTTADLYELKHYIATEHTLASKHPWLFEGMETWRIPKSPRSANTIYSLFKLIGIVVDWAKKQGIPTTSPFAGFELSAPVYGIPYFLNLEERDRIYALDLAGCSARLNRHRDAFMFQCMVGCRKGDLDRLSFQNIKDGILEYMPHKTMKSSGRTVRVPLTEKAKAILEKYEYRRREKNLFRCLDDKQYNASIRELCRMAGVTRSVSILDPKTRREVQRPICEIASSHLARRTFIGNLYRKVKDPNLIASMSGHVEGSKAFNRYRAIDDSMKVELVGLIS